MIGWNFPSNGGGQIRGIADAGIETFTGKKISSLARETCQNSLDAAIDDPVVTVEFYRHEIDTRNIPGFDEYKNFLQACLDYWFDNPQTKNFLDAAIRQINFAKTSVLRISDFNTTGLDEPFNPQAKDGWNTLTKIDGGATKSGDKAGSFGIGKNAPFTNSFYRLVFYRTLNRRGERAAQGMSRLMSFALDEENISAGVGYFGETNKNLPVTSIAALDKIFSRNACGTDIFVYGFNGGTNWHEDISVELIENFLIAIHKGKLCARIQGEDLTQDTLKNFVRRYADKLANAADYYKVLAGDDVKTSRKDFHGMGQFKLRVIVNQEQLNRRILVVRQNGMKIFDMDRFPRSIYFTGILESEGRDLNEFLRELETPSHDKWDHGRYKNPKLARDYLKELRSWVRDEISKLGIENFSDEVNVEGLSEMLAFDDGAIGSNVEEVETLDLHAEPKNFLHELQPDVDKINNSLSVAGNNDFSRTRKTYGDITPDGQNNAIRTLSGRRKRKTLANHSGTENPDGKDIILEPAGKKVACRKVRVIKVGEKNYRLILHASQNILSGRIEIFAVGENGEREKLFVTRASSADSNAQILTVGDKITVKNLRGNTDTKINFELQDKQNYALEVDVCED